MRVYSHRKGAKERGISVLKFLLALVIICIGVLVPFPHGGVAADFRVYSVYRAVGLGGSEETPQKDYYISMGTAHGLQKGSLLQVTRRVASYDLLAERLYRDVTIPVALIKVIHAESMSAIARLEKVMPSDLAPAASPRAVMVGDLVEFPSEKKEN